MIDKSVIADPKTHYGPARASTRHFIWQRFTGALNVVFTLFFAWFVVRLAGADRAEMVMVLRDHPAVAIALALLIVNVAIHMRIGMNEVIEDYIDNHRQNVLLRRLNAAFAIAVAALTILAIAKIMFWG